MKYLDKDYSEQCRGWKRRDQNKSSVLFITLSSSPCFPFPFIHLSHIYLFNLLIATYSVCHLVRTAESRVAKNSDLAHFSQNHNCAVISYRGHILTEQHMLHVFIVGVQTQGKWEFAIHAAGQSRFVICFSALPISSLISEWKPKLFILLQVLGQNVHWFFFNCSGKWFLEPSFVFFGNLNRICWSLWVEEVIL